MYEDMQDKVAIVTAARRGAGRALHTWMFEL
jgi:hypothetical protein